jgi:hypothetical protein
MIAGRGGSRGEAQRVFLSYLSPKDSAFADLLLENPRAANLKGETIVAFREQFPAIDSAKLLTWLFAQKAPGRLEASDAGGRYFLESLGRSHDSRMVRRIIQDRRFDRLPLWYLQTIEQLLITIGGIPSDSARALDRAMRSTDRGDPSYWESEVARKLQVAIRETPPL